MKKSIYLFLWLFLLLMTHACKPDKSMSESEALDTGKEITSKVFTALAKEVKGAIKSGGVSHAIDYCKLEAIPLTDSLSQKLGYQVKRATDRPRNPKNLANDREMKVIREYRRQLAKNEKLSAIIENIDGKKTYYSPILINDFCLQCHGTPGKNIKKEDMSIIRKKYPEGQAINYHTGDLRGVWVVQLNS